jgi:hypothetical protein
MTRSTFKVLFYLKRQAERNGKVPVMGRITVNGTISQFSCKLSVSPKLWDTRANKATGKSVAARCINEKLENIKTNIGKQYQRICDRDAYVTAEKVRNAWMGFGDDFYCRLSTSISKNSPENGSAKIARPRHSKTIREPGIISLHSCDTPTNWKIYRSWS